MRNQRIKVYLQKLTYDTHYSEWEKSRAVGKELVVVFYFIQTFENYERVFFIL